MHIYNTYLVLSLGIETWHVLLTRSRLLFCGVVMVLYCHLIVSRSRCNRLRGEISILKSFSPLMESLDRGFDRWPTVLSLQCLQCSLN